jgi:hypothetical protein
LQVKMVYSCFETVTQTCVEVQLIGHKSYSQLYSLYPIVDHYY